MLVVIMFAHWFNHSLLVVAIGYLVRNLQVGNVVATPLCYHSAQFVNGMESHHFAWRITDTIYYMGFKTIGVVDNRMRTGVVFSQTIGIQFRLMATSCRIYTGALGFHYSQWRSVCIKQYIVRISHTALIGHTLYLYLYSGMAGDDFTLMSRYIPTCLVKQQVDIQFSGFCFREVVYNRLGIHRCRLCIWTFFHRFCGSIGSLRGRWRGLLCLRNNGNVTWLRWLGNQLFVKVR